ncbi:hypothetical protein T439DRAFT_321210 [Meredithblackwellia eburnea MCA 4105]
MTTINNYYSGNPLNRLSYLRTSSAFLASALSSPKAKFVLFNKLNPLVLPRSQDGTLNLHTLGWEDVKHWIGDDASRVFKGVDGKDDETLAAVNAFWKGVDESSLTREQKTHHFVNQPALVFLGVDERSAPDEAKSLPLSKPTDSSTLEQHSPYGVPYWALDTTTLDDLRDKVLKEGGGEFTDMRAGMSSIPAEQAALAGEGRALVDWNTRNRFCTSCSRPLRPIWAGWKRTCVPGEKSSSELETPPVCLSKTGVHNFNYPRTDPVVIMAILSPDRENILLGRQRVWPKRFYSCLAGFIESGETIEEAVRREVYEEAGVEVGDVYYHSSQPWPYPSSLMIGAIGVAKPSQTIRLDLDNELEDARWFPRDEILGVLKGEKKGLTKEEVKRFDLAQQGKELKHEEEKEGEKDSAIRLPASTAIAHTLVAAWANNSYIQGGKL